MASRNREINASGAVVLRGDAPHREVLVIHRNRYDDWSLPKGKVDPDEYLAVTATREVREETGYRIRLRRQLTTARYQVNSHRKTVTWWQAELADPDPGPSDDEADQVAWWPIEKAIAELNHPSDLAAITEALRTPTGLPLLVVRHAKAMPRRSWPGKDADRRLTERGRRQAKALSGLLDAFGITELVSSSSTRCVKTLTPYAQRKQLEIDQLAALSEESAEENPAGVRKAMTRILRRTLACGQPLAVCGHRPVLPAMFAVLGVEPRHVLTPGEVVVVSLEDGAAGQIVYIPPTL